MKNDYLCPFCKGQLRVNDYIVVSAQTIEGQKGLIFLHPELGNYKIVIHPTFYLPNGEHLDVYCPICHADLQAAEVSDNLARIILREEDGSESQVLFSEIAGEHCTYVVKNDEMETYGDDHTTYMNYFGESPKY